MKYSLLLILLFALIGGCREYSEYKKMANGKVYIMPKNAHIISFDIVSWKVGKLYRQRVSKGVRLKISLPYLKESHLRELMKDFGIDSWLVRIYQRSSTGSRVIGHLYVPIVLPGRSKYRIMQMKEGFFNIYYAAAAISQRFESFYCPAFEHQRVVKKVTKSKDKMSLKKIIVGPFERETIVGKVTAFSYRPASLNGGMSLIAKYTVELALYNSGKKLKLSSLIRLPETIEVHSERERPIKGCADFKIPEKKSVGDKLKQFRWKKKSKR